MKTCINFLKNLKILCFSLMFLFIIGCDNEQKKENTAVTQEPVVEAEPEVQAETEEVVEEEQPAPVRTSTRPRVTRRYNKLTLDATSTSFRELDENNNFVLTRDDLFNGIFSSLDTKEDDKMTEEEFKNLKQEFFSNTKNNKISNFSEWDEDKSGDISREEFNNKLNSLIDIDDERSLAQGQGKYIVWDLDNDDKIEMLELENFVVKFDKDDN